LKLSEEDLKLFFKLHPALFCANRQLKIVGGVPTLEKLMELPLERKLKIRNALYDRMALIDSFVAEKPFNFSAEELEVIAGWKNLVKETFYLLRYLKSYAIFLSVGTLPKAYGVVALTDTFQDMLGSRLPMMLELSSTGKPVACSVPRTQRSTFIPSLLSFFSQAGPTSFHPGFSVMLRLS